MKNKLKKVIVGIVIASLLILPTVASAASGYLTGGISQLNGTTTVAWADYEHHTVIAYLEKYDVYSSNSGWGHCSTAPLTVLASCNIYAKWGYDGTYTSSASSYQYY